MENVVKSNKNCTRSILSFIATGVGSLMSFGGAFVTRSDEIKTSVINTFFFQSLGFLVPASFVLGLYFLYKAFKRKEYQKTAPTVLGVLAFLSMTYYVISLKWILAAYS